MDEAMAVASLDADAEVMPEVLPQDLDTSMQNGTYNMMQQADPEEYDANIGYGNQAWSSTQLGASTGATPQALGQPFPSMYQPVNGNAVQDITSTMPMDAQALASNSPFENGEMDWANFDQLVRQYGMDVDQDAGGGQPANWSGPNWVYTGNNVNGISTGMNGKGMNMRMGMGMGMGSSDWF